MLFSLHNTINTFCGEDKIRNHVLPSHNVGAQYSMEIRKYGHTVQICVLYPANEPNILTNRKSSLGGPFRDGADHWVRIK